MPTMFLLSHGQSLSNLDNRFIGWTDVDLSDQGTKEAGSADDILVQEGFVFDVTYTSAAVLPGRLG